MRFNNAVVEDTFTVGASAFNELRLGLNRVDLFRDPKGYELIPASISAQGISTSLSNFIHFLPTTYTIADNFSLIRGAHSMKFGLELREVRSVRNQGGPPSYSYNNLTDLINQKPATVGLSFGGSKGLRTLNTGFYAQDEWRFKKNFQVNLGVRYEYSPPLKGGFNVQGSDPFGPFIRAQQPMFAADRNDFAPRVGMVWTPGGSQRTVIRAGGGVQLRNAASHFLLRYGLHQSGAAGGGVARRCETIRSPPHVHPGAGSRRWPARHPTMPGCRWRGGRARNWLATRS